MSVQPLEKKFIILDLRWGGERGGWPCAPGTGIETPPGSIRKQLPQHPASQARGEISSRSGAQSQKRGLPQLWPWSRRKKSVLGSARGGEGRTKPTAPSDFLCKSKAGESILVWDGTRQKSPARGFLGRKTGDTSSGGFFVPGLRRGKTYRGVAKVDGGGFDVNLKLGSERDVPADYFSRQGTAATRGD